MFEGAVISFFRIWREAASGQLFHGKVVAQTLAADSVFIAAVIGAVAPFHIS